MITKNNQSDLRYGDSVNIGIVKYDAVETGTPGGGGGGSNISRRAETIYYILQERRVVKMTLRT